MAAFVCDYPKMLVSVCNAKAFGARLNKDMDIEGQGRKIIGDSMKSI